MAVKTTTPFSDFQKLTPNAFLYSPPSHRSTSLTILLLTWMNAAPVHIQFYIRKWQELSPQARIIVIPGTISNMVYVPEETQKRNLSPVLSALRTEPESPLYMHLFSNAGAQSAGTLLRAFKESSIDGTSILPLKGVLLDSTPSRGTYNAGYTGMSYQVPRSPLILYYLGLVLVHTLLIYDAMFHKIAGKPNVLSQNSSDLNDTNLVPARIPKVYLYSPEDLLVDWQDVEDHAAVAKSKGWAVKLEKFLGTDHCRHGKGDGEERYWGIVKNTADIK